MVSGTHLTNTMMSYLDNINKKRKLFLYRVSKYYEEMSYETEKVAVWKKYVHNMLHGLRYIKRDIKLTHPEVSLYVK